MLSGGDDCNLFLWELTHGGSGTQFVHSGKIGALVGRDLSRFYMADNTSIVKARLVGLILCKSLIKNLISCFSHLLGY